MDVSSWAESAFLDPEGHHDSLRVRIGWYDAFLPAKSDGDVDKDGIGLVGGNERHVEVTYLMP